MALSEREILAERYGRSEAEKELAQMVDRKIHESEAHLIDLMIMRERGLIRQFYWVAIATLVSSVMMAFLVLQAFYAR